MIARFQWLLMRMLDHLGMPWIFAGGLLLAAILVESIALVPLRAKLLDLEAAEARRPLSTAVTETTSAAALFLADFPRQDSLAAQLERLFSVARRHGLNLGEVTYRDEYRPGDRLEKYRIEFSVEATYPALRGFLAETLAALPYLSLDQVSFQRKDSLAPIVRSEVRMTFYLQR